MLHCHCYEDGSCDISTATTSASLGCSPNQNYASLCTCMYLPRIQGKHKKVERPPENPDGNSHSGPENAIVHCLKTRQVELRKCVSCRFAVGMDASRKHTRCDFCLQNRLRRCAQSFLAVSKTSCHVSLSLGVQFS